MPKKVKPATSDDSIRWLVFSRNKIQRVMLRLDQHRDYPLGKVEWDKHVGAAFSLWRAVFLCHDAVELTRKLEPDAREFLRTVVETNTIGFKDDKNASAWTGSYYIANAMFRLGMEPSTRIAHGTQRQRWEEAFALLKKRVPRIPRQPIKSRS
jgi:hypothetical protein